MPSKALVVDANILVRAVLGRRVREIIETYAEQVSFFVPEVAYAEAEEHVPALVIRRGGDPDKALTFLRSLRGLVELIGSEVYGDFESTARERLGDRDPEDWPILASALAIGCPIWTEDTDFFGCGVPTWTTSRVVDVSARPSEIVGNAEASKLVGPELVWLANWAGLQPAASPSGEAQAGRIAAAVRGFSDGAVRRHDAA